VDSNHRSLLYESTALPAELRRRRQMNYIILKAEQSPVVPLPNLHSLQSDGIILRYRIMGKDKDNQISRRDFIRICGAGAVALAMGPIRPSRAWENQTNVVYNADLGPNHELLPKEERSGTLVTKDMPVFLYPIQSNWLYEYYENWFQKTPFPVKEIKLTGVDMSFKDLFMSVKPDGSAIRYTQFPYITGDKLVAIGMYDKGAYNSRTGEYITTHKFYSNEVLNSEVEAPISQGHTIIDDFYPNKIWNDLMASILIDKHQHQMGGYRAGIPVSYVDSILAKVDNIHQTYRLGRAGPAAGLVPAGGVCATATNMCKLQIATGSQIIERQTHQVDVRYFYGPGKPFELTQKNADATVYYQDEYYREDLVWVPKKDQWIKISAAIIPYTEPIAGTARTGDAIMFLTFRDVNRDPGDQTVGLKKLQDAYDAWGKNPTEANRRALLNGCDLKPDINWTPDSEAAVLIKSISPEDRVSRFSAEIAREPILKDIFQLQALLTGYSYESHYSRGIYLGEYLKNSNWYESQMARLTEKNASTEDLEKVLTQLSGECNLGRYQQPMQCVGFDLLISALNYTGYPFFNFYDYDAANAKTFCPWNWRILVGEAFEKYTLANWQEIDKVVAGLQPVEGGDIRGRKFIAYNAKTLEEINVGDFFVNMEGESGHTGAIVGKKNINGDTVLLVADANGAFDGQIHIYEVDKCNFDIAFGSYPYPKTI
jgi:hypothetical protein